MSVLVLSLYITLFILFMSVTLYSLLCVPSKLCQLTIKRFAKKMKTFYWNSIIVYFRMWKLSLSIVIG